MNLRDIFLRFPSLEVGAYILRKIEATDAADLAELYRSEEVSRYLDWDGPRTEAEAKAAIGFFEQQYRSGKKIRWAIAPRDSDKLIGTIVLSNFQKNSLADLGYDLRPDWWGRGVMINALTALVHFCLSDLQLTRLQAYVRPEHVASARLLEKLGFEREGLLRQAGFHESREGFYDVILFARLRSSLNGL